MEGSFWKQDSCIPFPAPRFAHIDDEINGLMYPAMVYVLSIFTSAATQVQKTQKCSTPDNKEAEPNTRPLKQNPTPASSHTLKVICCGAVLVSILIVPPQHEINAVGLQRCLHITY